MTPSHDGKQNQKGTYIIRKMSRDELAIAVEWAAAEGWNPGIYDVDCFYAADPNGFLMGFLDGEPIASISVVKYGDTFGFLGFYIVRPEFRGRGYGIKIWQAGLDYLQGRNIGLDGVVEQQANYIKSEFRLAHRNIRYEGIGDSDGVPFEIGDTVSGHVKLVDLSSVSSAAIAAYDQHIFLGKRSAFLDCWLQSPHHTAIGLMYEEAIAGYGVLRPCQQGYKIGPLFADTPQFAETLFLALKSQVQQGVLFYLDVPGVNTAAVELAKKYRMTSVFETARMYTKELPELPLHQIFGITTFELG
ncbi:MAG: GNAT family N-acetyltransferase [Cyanobacteria bacterium J06560_6]